MGYPNKTIESAKTAINVIKNLRKYAGYAQAAINTISYGYEQFEAARTATNAPAPALQNTPDNEASIPLQGETVIPNENPDL